MTEPTRRLHCSAFFAMTVDGYIARPDGALDFLGEASARAGDEDLGYQKFISEVDVLVMGRKTFDVVGGFGFWPYEVPVVVVSHTMHAVPVEVADTATAGLSLWRGSLPDLAQWLSGHGHHRAYVDGGTLISGFLAEGLLDEMTITVVPRLIGVGVPAFPPRYEGVDSTLVAEWTQTYPAGIVQTKYRIAAAVRGTTS